MKLKENTPYMIRNDGEIFECGDIHPYILHDVHNRFSENIKILLINYPNWLPWLYKYTKINTTREKILEALQYLANLLVSKDPDYNIYKFTGINNISYIENILNIFNISLKPFNGVIDDFTFIICEELFREANSLIN